MRVGAISVVLFGVLAIGCGASDSPVDAPNDDGDRAPSSTVVPYGECVRALRAPPSDPNDPGSNVYDTAANEERNGDFENALANYRLLVSNFPKSKFTAYALLGLGIIEAHSATLAGNSWDQATKWLSQVPRYNAPIVLVSKVELANAYLHRDQFLEALGTSNEAVHLALASTTKNCGKQAIPRAMSTFTIAYSRTGDAAGAWIAVSSMLGKDTTAALQWTIDVADQYAARGDCAGAATVFEHIPEKLRPKTPPVCAPAEPGVSPPAP